ncbi:DUF6011 domain-containing protein [Gordonia sp. VNQ95]|uniref:DUF6011 domain-containing protein n=1 Tax=Gordonia sp. VNQ95 TaxID=3156619 RepID=UPI0032B31CE6
MGISSRPTKVPRNDAAPGWDTGGERDGNLIADSTNLESIIDPADKLMLAALRGGRYVLAVRCLVCGAPLTSVRSRTLGVGPDCRRKAVADA